MRIVAPMGITVILWIALSPAARGFKEGPYPHVTGGFGDPSCHVCHLDNPVNAPGGALTLAGVPATYTPGAIYSVTVTLTRDGLRRAGFEIAARFATGKQKGQQAGAWRPLDARVQLIPSPVDATLTFVQHNLAGSTAAVRGANTWSIAWTAPPASAGPVQFNVAGNASNNDDSPLGDYIYLKVARSLPPKHNPVPPVSRDPPPPRAAKSDGT